MTLLGTVLLYLSLIGMAVGVVSLLNPLRFLGIRTRRAGLRVLGLGFVGFLAGVLLPVKATRIEIARSRLDALVPAYQFGEFHSIEIAASKNRVDSAIRTVCPEEVRYFKTLTTLRGISSLAAEHRPMLASFTSGWFRTLADDPGREIVFGRAHGGSPAHILTPDEFGRLESAPMLKIAMNFHIRELDASHCTLTTETRVYAAGGHILRGFATYWRLIYPGSSLIRHEWLRAIKLRAETATRAARPVTPQ
jgi:hypothetical protein